MSSLAELRKELKEIRKSTVHPVSRMKKADLLAELSKHKGSSTVVEEKKAVEKVEKAVKEVKKAVKKTEVAEKIHEKVAEKVVPIKVPKEKKEPKAKKDTDPAPVKTDAPVLSKNIPRKTKENS